MQDTVHSALDAAREVYDVITGNVVLYTDKYGNYWNNKDDAGEDAYPTTVEEFAKSADNVEISIDYQRNYVAESMSFSSPSHDTDVTINFLDNTIIATSVNASVTVSYEHVEEKFALRNTIEELRENAII